MTRGVGYALALFVFRFRVDARPTGRLFFTVPLNAENSASVSGTLHVPQRTRFTETCSARGEQRARSSARRRAEARAEARGPAWLVPFYIANTHEYEPPNIGRGPTE